ncbi:disrupted in schizophrenia 1 protein isoform X2 [Hemicordylus capensis]|uniref:disrupted in schizophrenia 1 protein isoform X2 n=1 Tax=Hemicordylus capensis TaxID=884348 RepID=UPI00230406B0|nr:disrupted in schizophrenia 1 protein isoform X2 [Hemicordylus capensis]
MWRGASGERRQPQRGPPSSGSAELSPEIQICSLPAGSLHKKKLAKRPGYMRTEVLQQIEFQPPPDCEPVSPRGLEYHGRKQHSNFENCSLKRQCQNNLGLLRCDACVNSTTVHSNVTTGSAEAENTTGSLRNQVDHRVKQSENPAHPVSSVVAISKEEVSPVCSLCSWQANLLDPVTIPNHKSESQEEEKRMHALGQKEVNNNQEPEKKELAFDLFSPQDYFNSSFSFIQLSLNSTFETRDSRGPSDCSEAKDCLQIYGTGNAENVNLHVPGERQRTSGKEPWASSNYMCGEDSQCPRETIEDGKLQNCVARSLLHANAAFSCSTDSLEAASAGSSLTLGYESSNTVSDHSWDSLLRKYEPVLQDCLLGNRHILKIESLIRKLQRLQERAVAEDDYERADKFRRKFEELKKERNSLTFQLPSRHPSISSFLDRFRAQVQMALCGDAIRFNKDEAQPLQRSEENILNLPYREKIQVSASKREQLLEEKKRIQKEIEVLRARLVVLEAKDQQLRRAIEGQDQFIQAHDCELSTLLSWVSFGELQAISKALADTSEASQQIPCSLDFPEPIRRLQEKEQSLSLTIKDTAAKVCTSQKLCSTFRRKVSDIDTQLPALLEAKMLALSGGNFCTAKDLVEEIKLLTAERERLEGHLNEWLTLSARNVQKLERMKEGYKRLKEEMEQGENAFEKKLKENAFKYMEVLEEKLQRNVISFLQNLKKNVKK